jgi:diaminopimelate epimerase
VGAYSGEVGTTVEFRKGHGTGNDFVLLPDPTGELDLSAARVAAVCDRRFGLGADGILRVVPAEFADVPETMTAGADWFMDYRNADGSIAEMCGNGARVFARYLVSAGLVPAGDFTIGTRGGPRQVSAGLTGQVSVGMGPISLQPLDSATVQLADRKWAATPAFAPNPHAVAMVTTLAQLGEIESATAAPTATFPDGVNIEFVEVLGPDRVSMRVNERGSGETLSCGTGACAVAAVHRAAAGGSAPVVVTVPGGEVVVELRNGEAVLAGPAELVASGEIDPQWWASR